MPENIEETDEDAAFLHGFDRILSGAWSAQLLADSLRVLADGVCEVAGFGVAALSVLRDAGHLEIVAVAGNSEAERELLGLTRPISELEKDIADSVAWGTLRFVPHEYVLGREDDMGWVPTFTPLEHEDAWHPLDMLFAPLLDEDGEVRGVLTVDLPVGGLRPGPRQQSLLRRYVDVSSRVVGALLERERAAEELRLAAAARNIVRVASGQLSLDQLIETSQPEIIDGFRAEGMWLHAFDNFGRGADAIYSTDDREVVLPPELVDAAHSAARAAWAAQRVIVISRERPAATGIDPAVFESTLRYFESINVATALLVPLGAGEECLGLLVLVRNPGSREWRRSDARWAREISQDLGRAMFNARTFERERKVLEEVRALDSYKSRLIATVSHELRTPLTGILGYLELLEDARVGPDTRRQLNVVERNARRLEGLVVDLLTLSRVGDPARPVSPLPVDLRTLVASAVELVGLEAARRNLRIDVVAQEHVVAAGESAELDRLCSNLVSNAVKYSHDGGSVRITLGADADSVTLAVSDDGLGISEADRANLFGEFFRSTNPEALAQPGTGLGLAIVQRIVQRHRGRIEVDSVLGEGSTFTVTLPRA
ncbi:sensor histidine kinase [Nocardioides sp. Root151]|uniref:sensor histidine kinase n=1 Tax=Nocardioides sp. Root151 TaxID=1736475 RepID=UPI000702F4E9|nr:HAMP domain-containing sensor histidine kinase [Nocardioides sp. Root151]KQZ66818.1 hypothetical protein ASD66_17450 [Nocardioides sp. Root151]